MKVIEQHHPENREKGFIVNADQTQESTNDPAATHLDPYLSAVKRLDVIFSAANDYEEGARKMRDEFVVTKRADLPEVVEEVNLLRVDGKLFAPGLISAADRRRTVLRLLAVAEHLEAKEAREAREAKETEAAKNAKLTG